MKQIAIGKSYWEDIPSSCLRRMIEFESVREEYGQTYGSGPPEALFDDAPKFALEDIIDLTLLNSREYQSEKENLYSVALGLSLERFDYQLKPSVTGNGTAADYTHDRSGGETVNSLRVPTNLQVDKMLVTGAICWHHLPTASSSLSTVPRVSRRTWARNCCFTSRRVSFSGTSAWKA